eukprot:m.146299 g.146299  ORF g.146299 m.146299 type:complete len:824 (+) comp16083_c0_seq1:126-2597(+)
MRDLVRLCCIAAIFATIIPALVTAQQDCLQAQSSSCPTGTECFLIKDLCTEEVDLTTDCPGVCDQPLSFDLVIQPGSDALSTCKQPCNTLAESATIGGRRSDCEAGCELGDVVTDAGDCRSLCSTGEDIVWENDCTLACQRIIDIKTNAGMTSFDCSTARSNCSLCTAQACGWCQIMQADQIIYADCVDVSNTEAQLDCMELGGTFTSEAGTCPSETDPCAAQRPCSTPTCNDQERLMIYPLMTGECCPQTECVPQETPVCSAQQDCGSCLVQDGCVWCSDNTNGGIAACLESSGADLLCAEEGGAVVTNSTECSSASCSEPCPTLTCDDGYTLVETPQPGMCCPLLECRADSSMCHTMNTCGDCLATDGCSWCDLDSFGVCFAANNEDAAALDCQEQGGVFFDTTDTCDVAVSSTTTTTTTAEPTTTCDTSSCVVPICLNAQRLAMTGSDGCCPTYECQEVEDCLRGETPDGGSCRCTLDKDNCFSCSVSVITGEDLACARCRNSRYLRTDDFTCVTAEMCPPGAALVGSGGYGRRCSAPFTCVDGVDDNGYPCECPSSCTSCVYGQGVNNVTCLACHSDYYLIQTECLPRGTCIRNHIEGSPTNEACDCGIESCHRCRIIKATGEVDCTHCRDSKYLFEQQCLNACPSPEVAVGAGFSTFGRYCHPGDVTCRSRKVITRDSPFYGATCPCDPACHICTWTESGNTCSRCRDAKYLLDGQCVDTCPSNYTHSGVQSYGRECLSPFTCRGNRHDTDRTLPCQCADRQNCFECQLLAGNQPGEAPCTKCRNGRYLHQGECLKSCPSGTVSNGETGGYGRECLPL